MLNNSIICSAANLIKKKIGCPPPPRPSENVTLRLIIVDRATIATSPEPI